MKIFRYNDKECNIIEIGAYWPKNSEPFGSSSKTLYVIKFLDSGEELMLLEASDTNSIIKGVPYGYNR